jgi:signal peptidase I
VTTAGATPSTPTRGSAIRAAAELPLLIGLAILIAFVVKTFVAQPFSIPSESMVPQLEVGDRVAVSKLAYRLHDPRRGDVVVFDSPYPEEEAAADDASVPSRVLHGILESIGLRQPSTSEYIKRIVGLPGDTVSGHDGKVWVNGRELVEPYLPPGTFTSDFSPITVAVGQLWVMGDNRSNSKDSRSFGPIDRETVVGRAIARVWPPPRVAFM